MGAVPAAYTWTVGELVTAAKLNEHLRDALSFLLAPPHARLRHSTTQSIPNTTLTAINFDTEDADTDGGHSTVTNNFSYVAQTAGVYLVDVVSAWVANGTGKRHLEILANNTTIHGASSFPVGFSTAHNGHVSFAVPMSVGDDVRARVYQDSGGALNITNASNGGQRMTVTWLRTYP